ncbi:hypothetical protein [Cellulomonas xylanilytica]|uniref:Glycosyltransferase RgtA/B/C/D-like domain-containing protein n=1 Tax=Cellulomonas xylanilytica TaxID=233583 RepID=A0A510UZ74_9CELL|nr:hypothetical protein [Cellulomonas xylanilytica]GEK19796.1 hypothetical protein CXY01_03160 [Cellulomonas xylanilytica]
MRGAQGEVTDGAVRSVPTNGPLRWPVVAVAFVAVSAALSTLLALTNVYRDGPLPAPFLQGPGWLDGWFQGDSAWYWSIASTGYSYVPGSQSSIAFFPVYPLGVRGLGGVLDDVQLAGSLLGVLAGLAAVLLFARWVWTRLPRRSAVLAIAVLLVYPYSFFLYGAMYADSLFLLCAISAFVLLERRWYLAAGLVGALATAGRPVGIAVAVGLVVRTLEMLAESRRASAAARTEATEASEGTEGAGPADAAVATVGWRDLVSAVRDVRLRHLGVLTAVLGIVAWCVYLGLAFGHPLAWIEVEAAPGWNQGVGPKTWFKLVYAGTLIKGPYDVAAILTLQALACLCAVLLLRRVWRLFGWGYLAFAAVVLLIPLVGTKDFMGTGRYVLVAFPVVAAAGDFLAGVRHRWVRVAVLCVCAALLFFLTYLYGRSVPVS